MSDIFENLQDDLDTHASRPAARPAPTHPCGQCGGTGLWRGGVNRHGKSKCFACNGKGSFKTSHAARQRARQQSHARKAANLAAAQEAFEAENPGMIAGLREAAGWSSFAASLCQSFDKYGALTEKQTAAAESMLAKIATRKAARAAQDAARVETVGAMAGVRTLLEKARNHLRAPKIMLQDSDGNPVKLAIAGPRSRYAGQIMITDGGPYGANTYYGRIDSEGVWHRSRAARDDIGALLRALAEKPAEVAASYGHTTGNCCFCRRGLTDSRSVAVGYGPHCADHYGLPWG